MRTFEMESPSGLVTEMRTFKLKDTSALARAKASSVQDELFKILNNCTISVIDPGIYEDKIVGGKLDWRDTYEGDWFTALIRIRSETYGDKYDVQTECDRCGEPVVGSVNISDLVVGKPSEEVLEALRAGKNIFEQEVANVGHVKIRIPTGKEGILLAKERRLLGKGPIDDIVEGLDSRIVEIEGVPQGEKLEWLGDLDGGVSEDLFDAIDLYNFGTDTEAEVRCQWCKHLVREDVKFDAAFFHLTPKKRRRKR